MRIDSVRVLNFLSHHDTRWAPHDRLVALVGPNGAGKSSLAIDGPLYALYDAARGRTDDLVAAGASDMAVQVEFALGQRQFRVTRGRSAAARKTYLELLELAGGAGGWQPLTGDTIRDTQEYIDQLLRVDAATFQASVMLVQGRLTEFVDATPAERKRVLGTVVGLDVWAAAEVLAKARRSDARGELRVADAALDQLRAQLENFQPTRQAHEVAALEQRQIEELLAMLAKHITPAEADVAAARAAIAGHQARLEAAGAARDRLVVAKAAEAGAQDRLRAARWRREQADTATKGLPRYLAAGNALPGRQVALARAQEAKDALAAQGRAIGEMRDALQPLEDAAYQAVATWQAERDSLQRRITALRQAGPNGKPVDCPSCGATFVYTDPQLAQHLAEAEADLAALGTLPPDPPDALLRMRAATRQAIAAYGGGLASAQLSQDVVQAQKRLGHAQMLAGQAAAASEALVAGAAAEADVDQAQADVDAAGAAVVKAVGELGDLEEAATELEMEQATERAAVAEHQGLLAEQATHRTELQAQVGLVAQLAERLATLEALAAREAELATAAQGLRLADLRLARLVEAFGVNGIPARIIEAVLPELGQLAQALLEQLRPGMQLELRAQRAAKAGPGMIESLDVVVRDAAGERPLAMFSGGERTSVALALAVGLARLVARRAGTAIRTLVIDEPDGLDADARRALGGGLRLLAHSGELERVVLVSHHQDLAEAADAVYTVSRTSGGSSVVTED